VSTLAFVAAMTGSLAWPIVVTVALILFRHSIRALVEKIGSLRIGNWGADFDNRGAEAAATGVPIAARAAHPVPADSEMLELANQSPRLAIIESATRLEAALRNLADKSLERVENRPPGQLIRELEKNGTIDRNTANSLQGLFVMRNLAVHGPESELTTQRAVDFISLANAILFVLSTKS
jgi:hypothetical protein